MDSLPTDGGAVAVGDDAVTNGYQPMVKAVGGVYQCEICGNDYTAKVTWQKHCPDCGAERRRQVRVRKKKT